MATIINTQSMLKRSFIILLFSILALTLSSFQTKPPVGILWGSREIQWSDFKGRAERNSGDAAHISCMITIDGHSITSDSMIYTIQALMDPAKSWTLSTADNILMHERRHFDITEIYVRKLRKAIQEKTFKRKSIVKEINSMFTQISREYKKEQLRYDKESDHSRNIAEQEKWENKILSQLMELKDYAAPIVPIHMD